MFLTTQVTVCVTHAELKGYLLTYLLVYRPASDVTITCLTPPINDTSATTAAVLVVYDGGITRRLTTQMFTYYNNPAVSDVTPRRSYRRSAKTSGSLDFILRGVSSCSILGWTAPSRGWPHLYLGEGEGKYSGWHNAWLNEWCNLTPAMRCHAVNTAIVWPWWLATSFIGGGAEEDHSFHSPPATHNSIS